MDKERNLVLLILVDLLHISIERVLKTGLEKVPSLEAVKSVPIKGPLKVF